MIIRKLMVGVPLLATLLFYSKLVYMYFTVGLTLVDDTFYYLSLVLITIIIFVAVTILIIGSLYTLWTEADEIEKKIKKSLTKKVSLLKNKEDKGKLSLTKHDKGGLSLTHNKEL